MNTLALSNALRASIYAATQARNALEDAIISSYKLLGDLAVANAEEQQRIRLDQGIRQEPLSFLKPEPEEE